TGLPLRRPGPQGLRRAADGGRRGARGVHAGAGPRLREGESPHEAEGPLHGTHRGLRRRAHGDRGEAVAGTRRAGQTEMRTVTLIPGGGTGPELTAAMRRAVDASGAKLKWEVAQAGEEAAAKH